MTTLQHSIWEMEHEKPSMFPFLTSDIPNPGVVQFWDWIISKGASRERGLDICCGKGRNSTWLASKSARMSAFDFSTVAITEARRRQSRLHLPNRVDFAIQNAMRRWPYESSSFDFVVDCFGTSDIESAKGRKNLLDEVLRVLKPGGYYSLQIDSPEMGFFAERYRIAPGPDFNTLAFPNGKIESVLTDIDIANWDHALKIVEVRTEIDSISEIYGQTDPYKYFWIVMQVPFN